MDAMNLEEITKKNPKLEGTDLGKFLDEFNQLPRTKPRYRIVPTGSKSVVPDNPLARPNGLWLHQYNRRRRERYSQG